MRIFLAFITGSLALISCNNGKGEMNGGPCSYSEKIYPAKLLQLVPIDSTAYDAVFELAPDHNTGSKTDTVYFYRLNNNYIPRATIITDSITAGNTYRYVLQTITSGDCNPMLQRIRLEKYK